jgi:hypothetical protein
MLIKRSGPVSAKARFARLAICALLIPLSVCADSPLLARNSPQENQQPSSSRQLVVVIDINPGQRKVFSLESDLATGVLDHLNQPDDAVSLITFGSEAPVLRIVNARPNDALLMQLRESAPNSLENGISRFISMRPSILR